MTNIDLSPLYRTSIGFDHLASLLDSAFRADSGSNYPPYDIEALGDDRYGICIAVAGFNQDELDVQVENGVLAVRGKKRDEAKTKRNYLYQGIANRAFERKFNLADHVEVTGAKLVNGLLTIELKRELPEAMKPKRIAINSDGNQRVIEHQSETSKAA
ncbi:MAG: Hsp20 family protein [Gammaproteobacteria bacterium]|nr:Hsp20 family protein [Gammaproteobacteria bacterium]